MALSSASWPLRHSLALSFVIGCIQCFFVIPNVADGFSTQKLISKERNLDQRNSPLLLQVEAQPSSTDGLSDGSHLIFPGGGIFFYWQAGVVSYLREEGYDLSSCSFSGASAGALTATLATAEVDFYEATDLALKLAADAGVWDRSKGLQGIWGPMIEEWLDTLLPASINGIEGRLSLLVTPIPSFGKTKISSFLDKKDLIECNMASIHLPWFLDGKLTSSFRDSPHIDGSFLSKPTDYLSPKREGNQLVLDWTTDPAMQSKGVFDMVEALSPEFIWELVDNGKAYAKTIEQQGAFEGLKKKESVVSKLKL